MANEEGRAGRSAAWGVLAVVVGAGAIYTSQLATTPNSGFPIWPTYLLGVPAALALYMCFATIWGWWPTARAVGGSSTDAIPPSVAAQESDTPDAASGPSVSALPSMAATGTTVPVLAAGEASGQKVAGHVFISYVDEDSGRVDQLQRTLQAAGIPVWRDTADLWPGEDWRARIRGAITSNALVFLACFSRNSLARSKSYQNEELVLAIGQLRQRPPERPWLIPVRLDDCEIPDRDIGGGRTLTSIQPVDLFGDRYDGGARRLVAAVLRILGPDADSPRTETGPAPQEES